MSTTTNLDTLKINYLTQEQYDDAVENEEINENELYFTPGQDQDIFNGITGSGTSGYLTKFNGVHTITDGPALGSSTTTFLRNDGTWAIPLGTTYSVATTSADGLMSSTDKVAVDKIGTGSLNTTNQTLISAINEVDNNFDSFIEHAVGFNYQYQLAASSWDSVSQGNPVYTSPSFIVPKLCPFGLYLLCNNWNFSYAGVDILYNTSGRFEYQSSNMLMQSTSSMGFSGYGSVTVDGVSYNCLGSSGGSFWMPCIFTEDARCILRIRKQTSYNYSSVSPYAGNGKLLFGIKPNVVMSLS